MTRIRASFLLLKPHAIPVKHCSALLADDDGEGGPMKVIHAKGYVEGNAVPDKPQAFPYRRSRG
jgi:hypothetical protein